jgi:hypothetical protein
VTVKLPLLVADPPGVVTLIGPLVAPLGTVAVICVPELTVKVALAPLKETLDAPVRLVPVIVTDVPTGPDVGLNPLIAGGGGVTVKLEPLVAVPPGVVTEIGPLLAPTGTVAAIWPDELTVNDAPVPLKETAVAPFRLLPLIVIDVPTTPAVGLKPVIVGPGRARAGPGSAALTAANAARTAISRTARAPSRRRLRGDGRPSTQTFRRRVLLRRPARVILRQIRRGS